MSYHSPGLQYTGLYLTVGEVLAWWPFSGTHLKLKLVQLIGLVPYFWGWLEETFCHSQFLNVCPNQDLVLKKML